MAGALKDSGMTAYDLSRVVGMTVGSVRRYLSEAKEDGQIYVADWYRASARGIGQYMPVYRYGNKRDKPKPQPVSGADRQKNYKRKSVLSKLEKIWCSASYSNGRRV